MASNRIAILGSANSWYFQQLASAAESLDCNVEHIDFSDLAIATQPANRERLFFQTDFETALVRTMPLGSLEQVIFRMDVLRCWEYSEIQVINSSFCLETSIDKLLSLELFSRNQIPVPETYVCQTAEQAFQAFEKLDQDVVVKPIFGGEGRGIIRVCELDMAHRVFHALERTQSVIYCQRFVKNVVRDIRILLIGDKSFSIQRQNENSWKSNASLGGSGIPYQPTTAEMGLAFAARTAVEGEIIGVDILVDDKDNYFVLEVNAVPGWKLLQNVTQTNIAKEVVLFATQKKRS